jgi:hypothetical protein
VATAGRNFQGTLGMMLADDLIELGLIFAVVQLICRTGVCFI